MNRANGRRAGWTILLRLEGLTVLVLALALFASLDGSWVLFALLVLVPDLSMLGYLGGDRVGATTYNAAHTYVGPALLGGAGWWLAAPLWSHVALIWASHIAIDRLFGFGLKGPAGFGDTHLASIGNP